MPAIAEFKDTQQVLIHLLTDQGVLDTKKLELLREAQVKDNSSIEHVLIKKELATERDIAQAYADYLALPLYESVGEGVDPTLGRLLPEKLCRDQLMAPVEIRSETLDVVFVTPREM